MVIKARHGEKLTGLLTASATVVPDHRHDCPKKTRVGRTRHHPIRQTLWFAGPPTALSMALAIPALTAAVANEPIETLRSKEGSAYRLQIARPEQPAPAAGYPLLVVLDGDLYFEQALEIARRLAASGQIAPTVVAGLSAAETNLETNDARLRDFTDPVDERLLPERVRQAGSATGGVFRFIDFVGGRLMPRLQREVRFDRRCTILFGHSLGGLGVLHSLASRPEQFALFAASSPSIWWGDRSVLARLTNLTPAPAHERPRLLLTVGALEQAAATKSATEPAMTSARPDFRMIDNAREAVRLTAAQPQAVTTTFQMIANRTHATVARDAIRSALLLSAGCRQETQGRRRSGKAAKR